MISLLTKVRSAITTKIAERDATSPLPPAERYSIPKTAMAKPSVSTEGHI